MDIAKKLGVTKYVGETRTVYAWKRYAVKIPRVPIKSAVIELHTMARMCLTDISHARATLTTMFPLMEMQGPFRGWFANYREAQYSSRLEENVVPTILSLLWGGVNVMPAAEPFNFDRLILIQRCPGQRDLHTFGESVNYGWHDGRVRLLDYGNLEAIHYLLENGQTFRVKLDALADFSVDPLWNNPLMQRVYQEAMPWSRKNALILIDSLISTEPVLREALKKVRLITSSVEEKALIRTLDNLVSEEVTFTCDGIKTFRELFEGLFTQPPGMTGGFQQLVSPHLMAVVSNYVREEMPTFYFQQMQTLAMIIKGIEILSRTTDLSRQRIRSDHPGGGNRESFQEVWTRLQAEKAFPLGFINPLDWPIFIEERELRQQLKEMTLQELSDHFVALVKAGIITDDHAFLDTCCNAPDPLRHYINGLSASRNLFYHQLCTPISTKGIIGLRDMVDTLVKGYPGSRIKIEEEFQEGLKRGYQHKAFKHELAIRWSR